MNLWIKKGIMWSGKIGYSLLDQAAFSGSNFIINILLVRLLPIEQYGTFGVAHTIFLIASGFYNALILEPLSVLGPSKSNQDLQEYLRSVIYLQTILTLVFSLFFAIWAIFASGINTDFAYALVAVSIFNSSMLFFWLFRQVCYLQTKPHRSFLGSTLYAVVLLSCLALLWIFDRVNPFNVFAIMGMASAISAFIYWPGFRKTMGEVTWRSFVCSLQRIWPQQWNYGKWVTGTAVVYSFSTLVYPLLVGSLLGLTEAGIFRATQNLILPLQQTLASMSILFIPVLSRLRAMAGARTFLMRFMIVFLLFFFGGLGYIALLLSFGIPIFSIIYQNRILESVMWMIPYWSVIALVTCINTALSIGLRVLQKPRVYFYANALSALFTITFGIYAIYLLRLQGVMVSVLISLIIVLVVMVISFAHAFRRLIPLEQELTV